MVRPAFHLELCGTHRTAYLTLETLGSVRLRTSPGGMPASHTLSPFSPNCRYRANALNDISIYAVFSMSIEVLQHLEMSRPSYSSSSDTCFFPLTYTNGIPSPVSTLGAKHLGVRNNKNTISCLINP